MERCTPRGCTLKTRRDLDAAPRDRSTLGACDVRRGACIDADDLALVQEERHAHDGTRLELSRLLPARGGIAAHARIGLDDLELDVRGRVDGERYTVPEHHVTGDAVLEPDRRLAHRFLTGGELLERVGHHEMPEGAVVVEVLHFGLDDIRGLDRLTGPEVSLECPPGLEVADPDAVERLALAGLDELVLDDRERVAI